MSGTVPLLPLYAFVAQNRDDLTFTARKVPYLLQPLNFTECIPFCYAIHDYGRSVTTHLLARQASYLVLTATRMQRSMRQKLLTKH